MTIITEVDLNLLIDEYFDVLLEKTKYSFSSVQLTILDEKLKNKILKLSSLINESDLYNEEGYGRELSPHITIKYGIHTSDFNKIKEVMKLYKKKKISYLIKEISVFESDLYDVIILKIESDDLNDLNKILSENLKVTDTYPTYTPHITLAYVKKGTSEIFINNIKFEDWFHDKIYNEKEINFSTKNDIQHSILL